MGYYKPPIHKPLTCFLWAGVTLCVVISHFVAWSFCDHLLFILGFFKIRFKFFGIIAFLLFLLLLFCFSAFLLSLLLCFSSPLFCFSCFSVFFVLFLLCCFSAFLASLFFLFFRFCFSCFSAFRFFCFCAFLHLLFLFLQSCVFAALLLPAPLLLCFLSLLSLCFSFSFTLFSSVCILNKTLNETLKKI